MTAPERRGPERPGPDYPPEWDLEPEEEDRAPDSGPPVRILPDLRRLTSEELTAEVRSLRTGRARNLPVRLSANAALSLAHYWGTPGNGPGGALHALSRGEEVPRDALLADVDGTIRHCELSRPPSMPEEVDVDVQHLRLLREWVETQP